MIDLKEKKAIEDFLEAEGFVFVCNTDGWQQLWYGDHGKHKDALDICFDPKDRELTAFGRKGLISFQRSEEKFFLQADDVTVKKLKEMLEGLK